MADSQQQNRKLTLRYLRNGSDSVEFELQDLKDLIRNSEVKPSMVELYIRYLKSTVSDLFQPRYFFFSSTFFTNLLKCWNQRGHIDPSLLDTDNGENFFLKKYICIPVHFNGHWSLIVKIIGGMHVEYKKLRAENISNALYIHLDSSPTNENPLMIRRLLDRYFFENLQKQYRAEAVKQGLQFNLPSNTLYHSQYFRVQTPTESDCHLNCGGHIMYFLYKFIDRFKLGKAVPPPNEILSGFNHIRMNQGMASVYRVEMHTNLKKMIEEEYGESIWNIQDPNSSAAPSGNDNNQMEESDSENKSTQMIGNDDEDEDEEMKDSMASAPQSSAATNSVSVIPNFGIVRGPQMTVLAPQAHGISLAKAHPTVRISNQVMGSTSQSCETGSAQVHPTVPNHQNQSNNLPPPSQGISPVQLSPSSTIVSQGIGATSQSYGRDSVQVPPTVPNQNQTNDSSSQTNGMCWLQIPKATEMRNSITQSDIRALDLGSIRIPPDFRIQNQATNWFGNVPHVGLGSGSKGSESVFPNVLGNVSTSLVRNGLKEKDTTTQTVGSTMAAVSNCFENPRTKPSSTANQVSDSHFKSKLESKSSAIPTTTLFRTPRIEPAKGTMQERGLESKYLQLNPPRVESSTPARDALGAIMIHDLGDRQEKTSDGSKVDSSKSSFVSDTITATDIPSLDVATKEEEEKEEEEEELEDEECDRFSMASHSSIDDMWKELLDEGTMSTMPPDFDEDGEQVDEMNHKDRADQIDVINHHHHHEDVGHDNALDHVDHAPNSAGVVDKGHSTHNEIRNEENKKGVEKKEIKESKKNEMVEASFTAELEEEAMLNAIFRKNVPNSNSNKNDNAIPFNDRNYVHLFHDTHPTHHIHNPTNHSINATHTIRVDENANVKKNEKGKEKMDELKESMQSSVDKVVIKKCEEGKRLRKGEEGKKPNSVFSTEMKEEEVETNSLFRNQTSNPPAGRVDSSANMHPIVLVDDDINHVDSFKKVGNKPDSVLSTKMKEDVKMNSLFRNQTSNSPASMHPIVLANDGMDHVDSFKKGEEGKKPHSVLSTKMKEDVKMNSLFENNISNSLADFVDASANMHPIVLVDDGMNRVDSIKNVNSVYHVNAANNIEHASTVRAMNHRKQDVAGKKKGREADESSDYATFSHSSPSSHSSLSSHSSHSSRLNKYQNDGNLSQQTDDDDDDDGTDSHRKCSSKECRSGVGNKGNAKEENESASGNGIHESDGKSMVGEFDYTWEELIGDWDDPNENENEKGEEEEFDWDELLLGEEERGMEEEVKGKIEKRVQDMDLKESKEDAKYGEGEGEKDEKRVQDTNLKESKEDAQYGKGNGERDEKGVQDTDLKESKEDAKYGKGKGEKVVKRENQNRFRRGDSKDKKDKIITDGNDSLSGEKRRRDKAECDDDDDTPSDSSISPSDSNLVASNKNAGQNKKEDGSSSTASSKFKRSKLQNQNQNQYSNPNCRENQTSQTPNPNNPNPNLNSNQIQTQNPNSNRNQTPNSNRIPRRIRNYSQNRNTNANAHSHLSNAQAPATVHQNEDDRKRKADGDGDEEELMKGGKRRFSGN